VWLLDVLLGTAVIESPETKFWAIKTHQMVSWKVQWPGYTHISIGLTEEFESNGSRSAILHTRFDVLKTTAELVRQFMETAMEVGSDGEAGWWTISKNGIDIEHVRIMSLDWHYDNGVVLVPRLWVAGM